MKYLWLDSEQMYDGSQLRSLYNYLEHGLLGDSIVAWCGPCDVNLRHMVDGEDKRENAKICGDQMLHFLIESVHEPLSFGVALQRLFATIVASEVEAKVFPGQNKKLFFREGDDLYWNNKKFSISIATVSPVSTLIHFAVNVTNAGTPVPTCALEDFYHLNEAHSAELKSWVKNLALSVLQQFCVEFESIKSATCKVHWVK